MYTVLVILILLIDASPAILIIGEPWASGLVCVVMAIAGVIIAFSLRPSESNELGKFFRPLVVAAGLPAGWILIQMLPMMNLKWAHPVWQSAAAALGTPILGSFSIDRGLTLVALCNYTVAVAIMFVAAAVAVDRHRAKWILVALTGATTLIAIVVVVQDLAGVTLFSDMNTRVSYDAAIDCVAMGAILCVAAAVGALDRSKSPRSNSSPEASRRLALIASLAAFAVCAFALVHFRTIHALFALAFGLATFFAITASRRFGLNSWGIAGVASMTILAGSSIIAAQPRIYTSDPTLAFADAPKSLISITERILADGSWTGSGAGTFKALVPIYKDTDDPIVDNKPPTIAAAIVVELGRPAFLAVVAIAIFGMVLLFHSGLVRRRNSFYPAAGASCLCTATLLAFSNIGLLTTPCFIIFATTLGMAFGQSMSRAAPQPSEQSDLLLVV